MSTLPPQPASYPVASGYRQQVVVTDIDMTIGAMCRFMVKWVIAAIPAVIILWILMLIVGGVLALLFGGIFHGLLHPRHF